jgi:hypothetical protein
MLHLLDLPPAHINNTSVNTLLNFFAGAVGQLELAPMRTVAQVKRNIKHVLRCVLELILTRVHLFSPGFPWEWIFKKAGSAEDITAAIAATKATLEKIVERAKCPTPQPLMP